MIKIENFEVIGWEHAIRGMRNPMNSWAKSDSLYISWQYCDTVEELKLAEVCHGQAPIIKENDHTLIEKLVKGGPVHAKFRRMITVYVDITAPLYWWKEFDTYKVGTVANSCSTMHKIHEKEFTLEDFSCEHLNDVLAIDNPYIRFTSLEILQSLINVLNAARNRFIETKDKIYWWQMIQLLPSSYNQKRTVMLNYEVLANIYEWRRNHKLDEWVEFCHWIESLPYSEIITGPSLENIPICHEIMEEAMRRVREEEHNPLSHPETYVADAIDMIGDMTEAQRMEVMKYLKVKTPEECPYWNYKEHKSIYQCNGCEEENQGVMVNSDRYCNIPTITEEEE